MQLYDDQIPTLDSMIRAYKARETFSTVNAPTSYGKTTVTMAFCKWLVENTRDTVWIVVHRKSLLMQWWRTAKAHNVQDEVGIIWAQCPKKDPDDKVTNMPSMRLGQRIQLVLLQSTSSRVSKNTPRQYWPDVMVTDEIHESYNYGQLKALERIFSPLMLSLTGTPESSPGAKVKFEDIWPPERWITTKSPIEMLETDRWTPIEYVLPSPQLQQLIADRFAGMRVNKHGDFPTTRQRDVFADMAVHILGEWYQRGYHKLCSVFACVDVKTARLVQYLLSLFGVNAELLLGETEDQDDVLDKLRDGRINTLVSVSCFTTGVDVPRVEVCVMMKLFGNIAQFHQMIGRFVRKYPGKGRAIIMDVAGNLNLHETPESITDWRDRDRVPAGLLDKNSTVCAQCGHDHKTIPKPLSIVDTTYRYYVRLGMWEDDVDAEYNHPIVCHKCSAPVMYDEAALDKYTAWLQETREILKAGGVPTRYTGGKGIYVGGTSGVPLTVGTLYDVGVWKLSKTNGETELIDRSDAFIDRMRGASQTLENDQLTILKKRYLPTVLKQIGSSSFTAIRLNHIDLTMLMRDCFILSYVHGSRQSTLRNTKIACVSHNLTPRSIEITQGAIQAVQALIVCPVSREIVINWVCQVCIDNNTRDKVTNALRDALFAALLMHIPELKDSISQRLLSIATQEAA